MNAYMYGHGGTTGTDDKNDSMVVFHDSQEEADKIARAYYNGDPPKMHGFDNDGKWMPVAPVKVVAGVAIYASSYYGVLLGKSEATA